MIERAIICFFFRFIVPIIFLSFNNFRMIIDLNIIKVANSIQSPFFILFLIAFSRSSGSSVPIRYTRPLLSAISTASSPETL